MITAIRIATRNSQLALWQAEEVKRLLLAALPGLPPEAVALVPIQSDGDIEQTQGFAQFGYKGAFTKRIEAALLDGRADIAVHSMKDMHSHLPESLTLAAFLPREDPRDAFISTRYPNLSALPQGAKLGTSSIRRAAIIRGLRPDLEMVEFRGNVPTRLKKLADGEVDATLLAVAGLKRLKLDDQITEILPPETMLPAVAQGIIGIECRVDDSDLLALLQTINHPPTAHMAIAERAMLAVVDGDCKTPLSGHATLQGDTLTLTGRWYHKNAPGGFYSARGCATVDRAAELGREAGETLKQAIANHDANGA